MKTTQLEVHVRRDDLEAAGCKFHHYYQKTPSGDEVLLVDMQAPNATAPLLKFYTTGWKTGGWTARFDKQKHMLEVLEELKVPFSVKPNQRWPEWLDQISQGAPR